MLIPIANVPRDYAWGSTDLIAELQGRAPSGRPEAEIWFGDHPGSPSIVQDGSRRTLRDVLTDAGSPPLPYLLKLLAAGSPLSIQAHPSKAQAVLGFAREEAAGIPRDGAARTYRDDNHKPELIVALSDPFRALAGLRPLAETRRIVEMLGGGAGPAALRAHLEGDDEALALRSTIEWLLSGEAQDEVDGIISAALAAAADAPTATAVSPPHPSGRTIRRSSRRYAPSPPRTPGTPEWSSPC